MAHRPLPVFFRVNPFNPPENAIVLSVDEKPSIQALERAQGYIRLPNGRAVSGFAHEYERHGTTTLFAALETATGLVRAGHYKRRRRREFLDFMNGVINSYGEEKKFISFSISSIPTSPSTIAGSRAIPTSICILPQPTLRGSIRLNAGLAS